MNLLTAHCQAGRLRSLGHDFGAAPNLVRHHETVQLGVRPEFVRFVDGGIPVRIHKVDDLGRHQVVEVESHDERLKIIVPEGDEIPAERPAIRFDPEQTHCFLDGWLTGLPTADHE